MENGNEGRFLFPLFRFEGWEKMGIRDGSFSHFSFHEKWEKEPSLIPIFLIYVSKKWEKEPSLIPIFPIYVQQKVGK